MGYDTGRIMNGAWAGSEAWLNAADCRSAGLNGPRRFKSFPAHHKYKGVYLVFLVYLVYLVFLVYQRRG